MKYYSEKLNKVFDTPELLKSAETKAAKEQAEREALAKKEQEKKVQLANERKARAQEVEEAYKHANELLNQFIKDYGSFHTSISEPFSFFDIFNRWF